MLVHSEILCSDLGHMKLRTESRIYFIRVVKSVNFGHLSEKWFSLQNVHDKLEWFDFLFALSTAPENGNSGSFSTLEFLQVSIA